MNNPISPIHPLIEFMKNLLETEDLNEYYRQYQYQIIDLPNSTVESRKQTIRDNDELILKWLFNVILCSGRYKKKYDLTELFDGSQVKEKYT